MSVTHVVGPTVQVRGRLLQRCAICGAKLVDRDVDGTNDGLYHTAMLVNFGEGDEATTRGCETESFIGDVNLPADFCLALVER